MTRGERIRRARAAAGLTQIELARRVGVSHTAVGQWERDEAEDIRHSYMAKLSRELGVSAEYLQDGKTDNGAAIKEPRPSYSRRKGADAILNQMEDLTSEELDLIMSTLKLIRQARRLRNHSE